MLNGHWEVGLMDVTYSTCVNTFFNDKMTIKERCTVADCVDNLKHPIRVMLPVPQTDDAFVARKELIQHINEKFATILQLSLTKDEYWCTWKILKTGFYFILSPGIEGLFHLWADVIATGDLRYTNQAKLHRGNIPTEQSDVFIIITPTDPADYKEFETFEIKKENEVITKDQVLERFKTRIGQDIVKLSIINDKQFVLEKLHDDNKLIVLNKPLRKAFTFERRGMFRAGKQQYFGYDFSDMKPAWTFTYIHFKNIATFKDVKYREIILPPISFEQENVAMKFVNNKVKDNRIQFSCNAEKHVTLNITDSNLTVIFDDILCDIFAFDKTSYSGSNSYTASGEISLKRCIQYLYIYSNITEYVRIGNTKSPLLAIIPFTNENSCRLLNEKIFKTPMYIPVSQNRISQIDIGIYDGAGKPVPFVKGAVTTLRLHFRQT